jgi:putative spermidine/putrescine transport system ATP-binding protein
VPPSAFTSLRLNHVGRVFAGQAALVDLTLEIAAGEFIALLGPSGCGKSTALNCVAGLLPLSTGSITIDDERVDTLPPEKRDFGMVFQNYALFPHMSVAKNVGFGLQMHKTPKDELRRRVAEALSIVKLEEYAARLPGQLSGGQQQRVAIARAIVTEPRLVLMDEPLSNLDAKLRLDMRGEIRRLHQSLGLTTIYVTHDQEEALSMADRLVVLRLGHVQQIGTPRELHDHPANWHVADFMGYRNLVDLPVTRRDGDAVTLEGAGMTLHGTARQDVTVGETAAVAIRPEDLRLAREGSAAADTIEATVEVSEYHGHDFAVDATTSTGQILHFIAPDGLERGEQVRLTADPARVLVYARSLDAQTEAGGADA